MQPSSQPTMQPSGQPSGQPTRQPTGQPSGQPTLNPTTHPTFIAEPEFAKTFDRRRYRVAGMCENGCSGHGTCQVQNDRCTCFKGLNGEEEWTGYDCSLRACPK